MQLNSLKEETCKDMIPPHVFILYTLAQYCRKSKTTSPKMEVFAHPYFLYIHCHILLDHTRLRTTQITTTIPFESSCQHSTVNFNVPDPWTKSNHLLKAAILRTKLKVKLSLFQSMRR
jgi:hypothetical protein